MLVPRSCRQMPAADHAEERGGQVRGAIDDGRVDHLSMTRLPGLEDRRQQADGHVHASRRIVADEVQRNGRRLAFAADGIQQPRQRQVVDVVAGRIGASGPSWPQPVKRP